MQTILQLAAIGLPEKRKGIYILWKPRAWTPTTSHQYLKAACLQLHNVVISPAFPRKPLKEKIILLNKARHYKVIKTCQRSASITENKTHLLTFYQAVVNQSFLYLAQKPFFQTESLSVTDLLHLDPNEKCRLKKGFTEELLVLELASIFGVFPSCLASFGL